MLGFAGNINHVYIKIKPGLTKYSDLQLNYMEGISFTIEKKIPLRKITLSTKLYRGAMKCRTRSTT
jgi:hypothetical protein